MNKLTLTQRIMIPLRFIGLFLCIPIICILGITGQIDLVDKVVDFWGIG